MEVQTTSKLKKPQKSSKPITELWWFFAAAACVKLILSQPTKAQTLRSPMLVILDHLHFQYNGFFLGILLILLSYLEEGRDLMGGLVFAVLLCFKHLFAVAAPVYIVYLLRHYCWKGFVRGFWRLFIFGAIVVAVFAVAYGPFVYHGQ